METTEPKTWTEIKLRNPDAKFCQELTNIMALLNEKSATKALEYLVRNYFSERQRMADLRTRIEHQMKAIENHKERAGEAEFKLLQIKNSYKQFTQLVEDVKDLPGELPSDFETYEAIS